MNDLYLTMEDLTGEKKELTLRREDFRDPTLFEAIIKLFEVNLQYPWEEAEDINEMTLVPEMVRFSEEAGGMGSAGYVGASVSDPGSPEAIFVPTRLYPRSKGKHIMRRKSLEKKEKK